MSHVRAVNRHTLAKLGYQDQEILHALANIVMVAAEERAARLAEYRAHLNAAHDRAAAAGV
jgi:hypothetical protein